jgi:hypothetical protein
MFRPTSGSRPLRRARQFRPTSGSPEPWRVVDPTSAPSGAPFRRPNGYDNTEIRDDQGQRLRVVSRLNEAEAAVVRRVLARRRGLRAPHDSLCAECRGRAVPPSRLSDWQEWRPSTCRTRKEGAKW